MFRHLRSASADWCEPPPPPRRFQTKRRRASRKRPAVVVLFLVLRQYLTQLWQVKGNIFGNSDFSTLGVHISKTIYRSGMQPSPACSPFNSAQNEVFWCMSVECLGRLVLVSEQMMPCHKDDVIGQIYDVTDPRPDKHILLVYLLHPSNRIHHLKNRL